MAGEAANNCPLFLQIGKIAGMGRLLEIHPRNPQERLIAEVAETLRSGGVVVYPTDSIYAIGCRIGEKRALERIRRLRELHRKHLFTLVCRDLSEIATYARVDNQSYRLIRSMTPGPYTFILPATKQVPKRLQHPRRRTIGIRVPTHPIPRALLEEMGEPLLSSTMQLPGDEHPLTEGFEIYERVHHDVDIVVDGGPCGMEPTSVVDLVGPYPEVVRSGMGNIDHLMTA
jgi:tRNA threonylcarbamoyl adenosine modification protein (Sua5/YciO/YrdC/YwlC family)